MWFALGYGYEFSTLHTTTGCFFIGQVGFLNKFSLIWRLHSRMEKCLEIFLKSWWEFIHLKLSYGRFECSHLLFTEKIHSAGRSLQRTLRKLHFLKVSLQNAKKLHKKWRKQKFCLFLFLHLYALSLSLHLQMYMKFCSPKIFHNLAVFPIWLSSWLIKSMRTYKKCPTCRIENTVHIYTVGVRVEGYSSSWLEGNVVENGEL